MLPICKTTLQCVILGLGNIAVACLWEGCNSKASRLTLLACAVLDIVYISG